MGYEKFQTKLPCQNNSLNQHAPSVNTELLISNKNAEDEFEGKYKWHVYSKNILTIRLYRTIYQRTIKSM